VAFVTHVPPDLGTITKAEFERALRIAAGRAGFQRSPKPGSLQYRSLSKEAMNDVLDTAWIEGEAAERGLTVSDAEINRQVRSVRSLIKSPKRFLRQLGMTQRDLQEKVRLQVLSQKVQNSIDRSKTDINDFVRSYQRKWRARTTCAPAYRIPRCSSRSLAGS
jgi:hypothetical protein